MNKKWRCGIFSALLLWALSSSAAEFTWFRLADGTEGWIEFASATAAGQNRIHVFPRLLGPNGADSQIRIEERDDGVVVGFKIQSPRTGEASEFVGEVLRQVAGLPSNKSRDYQVDLPGVSQAELRVVRGGEILARRSLEGKLPSVTVGAIKVPVSDQVTRRALIAGNFTLEAQISLPLTSYSGMAVALSERLAVDAKVEAFKSIVTQQSTSGGKFLFLDWRRQTARNVVTQSITQSQTSSSERRASVYSVDADEAMLAKVEKLLGFEEMSKEKVIDNHIKAAKRAEEAGDMELAKLHREYVSKLDAATPKVEAALLQKALKALGGDNPKIAVFLANGIAFSESSSVGVSRFQGMGRVSSVDLSSVEYAELKLSTSATKFLVTSGPFPITGSAVLGTIAPDEQSATLALIEAVNRADLVRARYAINAGGQPNGLEGPSARSPLMVAAGQCNKAMVTLLLGAQANPTLRDSSGRRARDYAKVSDCAEVVSALDAVPLSRLRLDLKTNTGVALLGLQAEDRGAILPGTGKASVVGTVASGDVLLRLVVKARLWVPPAIYALAPMFYDRQVLHGYERDADGQTLRVFDMEDVVRLSVDLSAGENRLERALRYDVNQRMFVLAEDVDQELPPIAAIQHMNDNLHFGVGPGAGMPAMAPSVCLRWKKIAPGSMVEECAEWGRR